MSVKGGQGRGEAGGQVDGRQGWKALNVPDTMNW